MTNRFKGLDLIDRVPEELWTEICDIVQEAVIKTITKKKTRDLFKKIRDTKRTYHAKMGSIKNRNARDLTEAEDIKKRWQEYKEELYKKDLHNPDNQSQTSWNVKSSGP